MADYKKMYTTLFNAVAGAIRIMQKSQRATEEIYISAEEPPITLIGESSIDNGENDAPISDAYLK